MLEIIVRTSGWWKEEIGTNKDTQRCRVAVGYKNTPDVLRAPDFSQRKLAWGKEREV